MARGRRWQAAHRQLDDAPTAPALHGRDARCRAPVGGDPFHTLQVLGHPDAASPQGDYTGLHDEREVFWCANKPSPINGHNGTYTPVDGGRRFQLGQWPGTNPAVFPNGPC